MKYINYKLCRSVHSSLPYVCVQWIKRCIYRSCIPTMQCQKNSAKQYQLHIIIKYLNSIRYFLMLVVTGSFFYLKGDFLSYFVLILIILSLSLWVLYNIDKLGYAHFWTSLGCSSYATNENLIYSNHLYGFVTQTWLQCTEKWTGSPFLHMLPPGDLAH